MIERPRDEWDEDFMFGDQPSDDFDLDEDEDSEMCPHGYLTDECCEDCDSEDGVL